MASAAEAKNAATTSPLLKTTLSLIFLQLFSRLFSFSLNQVLLRSTTPQALGVATMGLEVVRDTTLFLVREGIRGAVVRTRSSSSSTNSSAQLVSQTLLLPVLLSPLVVLLFLIYSYFPPSPLPPLFNLTLILYTTSAVIELIAERWYLETLKEWETLTSVRVRIEGAAVVTKALGTLLTMILASRLDGRSGAERYALMAFGIGQVVYSMTLFSGFWFSVRGRSTLSRGWVIQKILTKGEGEKQVESRYFDGEMKDLGWALTKQSFVKQLLTEGDKIILGRFSKVEDQGGYAVALGYGGLIARILFQPLEESSRLFFSRNLSSPTPASLLASATLLSSILLLHTHLSLIFILLVPSYTSPLLYHLLGPRWSYPLSSAPVILSAYCTYLPFLAINGITEAFFQSVADKRWLTYGSRWMGVCSIGFIVAVVGGVRMGMGETGLVYANCANMAMRIGFSSYFIRYYFGEERREVVNMKENDKSRIRATLNWRQWTPKPSTVGAFALSSWMVRSSEMRGTWDNYRGMGEHIGIGAFVGIACLGVVYYNERKSIVQVYNIMRSKED